jgi:hypothetical protein
MNDLIRNMTRSAVAATAALGFGAIAPAALAGDVDVTITTVLKQGESIDGFGPAGIPSDVAVNNSGFWAATVPITGGGGVLVTSDGPHMAVGDELEPGVVVSSLTNALKGLNNNGNFSHRPSFEGDAHSGLVFNDDVLILRDDISTAPQFSPGTPYIGFFRARVNDNNRIFLVATVSDSELPGSVHRALVWIDYDPDSGDFTEDVLFKRYDQVPNEPQGVQFDEFGTGAERFAINNHNEVIFTAGYTGGDPATNAAIYFNDTVLAQKGDTAPDLNGDTYNIGTSAATRVHMNDNRDYVFLTPLTGDSSANQAIIRNNVFSDALDEVVIRKGDPVPGLPGHVITSLGTGAQPMITENGDVIWYGQWDGDAGTNHGLFINDQLIIQRGVTQTSDGDLITTVAGTTSSSNGISTSFDVSQNGQYILVRAMLNNSTSERAVLLVEVEDSSKCAPADLDCNGVVDGADLAILLGAWGPCADCDDCDADLDGSCEVDGADLAILLGNWG